MASGSSKGINFASDDILCSYEDNANQQQSNGSHSDSVKEFNKSRMARTSVFAAGDSDNQEVILMAVERSMKKHTDNVMRFLEGLSSRLSQLELYCYNLDKSVGEMRSDLTHDHEESNAKLKFLENRVQEVHRSVQILRDKQELADTQKELAKLKLARKESLSSSRNSRSSTPDMRKNEPPVESHGQHLALPPRAPEPTIQPQPQPQAYFLPQAQLYPQQWTLQVRPQPTTQPVSIQSSPPQVYPQYLPTKPPVNPAPELIPNSTPLQMTYSYSCGGPVRTAQPEPPRPHLKPSFGRQLGDGGPPKMYMVYDNVSGRAGGGGGGGMMSRPGQQFTRNHAYGEVIDKVVSMGYGGEHVMSVIRRLDENGQTVDFNGVLDRLNGHSSGGGWSGYSV